MCKKFLSLGVAISLALFVCSTTFARSSKEEKEAKLAANLKAGIAKIGTGPAARVEVKLRDNTKLKGYVDQVADDHFVIISDTTGAATAVAYPQVKRVKGNNLSTGAKIAIGIGVVALLVLWASAVSDRR
jgi:hypothetical protein